MSKKRILAAIMFTDIKGYTALMHEDEKKAFELRNRHRDTFQRTTELYNGEILQYFGDGTLSIFRSTVEAVECATEMQKVFLTELIPVRIGIHVGDIMYSHDGIVGDAVNIAARIESCADAGSVLISDKVHDHIRSHRHIKTQFLDAYEFKNVDEAIPIFAISNEGLVIPNAQELKGKFKEESQRKWKNKSSKKSVLLFSVFLIITALVFTYFQFFNVKKPIIDDYSIAVLPFDNLSTDDDAEIFRDGMTEDILTNLSKLKGLHVISRTSVMQYKETKKTIPEIAKELGVAYILEGSIRKYGDKIRVSAQLIEASSDEHIWANNYDKTLIDIFKIQSEVSKQIADALHLSISYEEKQNFDVIPTQNIDAYKLFLKGRQEADKRNTESIAQSIEFYEKAIAIDSNYAEAYAEIANSIFLQTYYGNADPQKATERSQFYLDKAEALNNNISRVHTVKGLLYNHSKEFNKAKVAFEKAIALSPNDVTARHQYATYFFYIEEYDKQLEQTEIAYSLDPLSFATASSYFSALTTNNKYEEAEKLIKDIVANNTESDPFIINRLYMRLYMASPDYKKAIEPLKYLAKQDPSYYRILGYSYGQLGDTVSAYRTIDSIKKLDKTRLLNHRVAVVFASLNKNDSVFYYLDTARNKSQLFNNSRLYYFDDVKKDSRYKKLLESHGIE